MSVSIGTPISSLPIHEVPRNEYDAALQAVIDAPAGMWVPFECAHLYERYKLQCALRTRCKKLGVKIQGRSDGQKRLWVRRIEKQKRKDGQ